MDDRLLDERSADALRQARELRADRVLIDRARGDRIAVFRILRQESTELSVGCNERRRLLELTIERWGQRWLKLGSL